MADEVAVSTHEMAAFARALKKAEPDIRKHLIERLRLVGVVVAEEAKSRISEYSAGVADSIKVRVSSMTVTVVAGGAGVPLAGLFELGNLGGTSQTSFRHPVFGSGTWAVQSMHPFLAPALAFKLNDVEQAAVKAMDDTIAEF